MNVNELVHFLKLVEHYWTLNVYNHLNGSLPCMSTWTELFIHSLKRLFFPPCCYYRFASLGFPQHPWGKSGFYCESTSVIRSKDRLLYPVIYTHTYMPETFPYPVKTQTDWVSNVQRLIEWFDWLDPSPRCYVLCYVNKILSVKAVCHLVATTL